MPRHTWQCHCGKRNAVASIACRSCRAPRASEDFDRLEEFLATHGFEVTRQDGDGYRFARVESNVIVAGFATYGVGLSYLDGRFAADHRRCFDKWSKCPLIIAIPGDDRGRVKLLEYLAYLGSKEGYKWSNSYDYLDDPRLPCEV